MHAVTVTVSISDRAQAEAGLHERVVPMVSRAPGFVAGYWLAPIDGKGASIAVFESEEAAREMASNVDAAPGGPVTIEDVSVREVVAHA